MITAQPAWVLSRQSYGDSGMLVEFFSAELGRCGAVVRGAHRRKRGGSLASLLQPFCPLLITFVGRSELKTLRSAEAPGPGYFLRGDALMSGLYLNELLVRSLPRMDVSPSLFLAYGQTIESLHEGVGEESLRRFELVLLSELGYSVAWDSDEQREPIKAEAHYRFEVDRGFVSRRVLLRPLDAIGCYRERKLFAFGSGGKERMHWESMSCRCLRELRARRSVNSRGVG